MFKRVVGKCLFFSLLHHKMATKEENSAQANECKHKMCFVTNFWIIVVSVVVSKIIPSTKNNNATIKNPEVKAIRQNLRHIFYT